MYLDSIKNSPIQQISEKLNHNTFYMKRDDLIPFSFGGNKTRKAIYFFDDLDKKKCDCVVTYGSSGSNHCRVIANIAASRKIPCYIISSTEKEKNTFNDKMIEMFGANITKCLFSDVSSTINLKLESLKKEGINPYFIKGGGHGNVGTNAYVIAYEEILKYEKEKSIFFDYVFLASGTGTTQAGLICGKYLNKNKRKIIGISIARKNPYGRQVILESVKSYLNDFGQGNILSEEITFIDDYILGGYGNYNEEILRTIKEILIFDSIPMDTTYTGKAYWGMKQYIIKNQIKGKNILFLHTGGLPIFFDNFGKLYNGFKI
jgi:D-cysteine desulfhydrase